MADKPKEPKKPKGTWNLYNISGNKLERKNKFCPKCGSGVFLAHHKNRLVCGNCHYMEKK
jgi:small subunit ribosomal protein S27Ae